MFWTPLTFIGWTKFFKISLVQQEHKPTSYDFIVLDDKSTSGMSDVNFMA